MWGKGGGDPEELIVLLGAVLFCHDLYIYIYIWSIKIDTLICCYGFLNGNKFLFRVFFWMEGDVRAWEQLPGFGCCGGGDVSVPLACTRGRCCETAFRQQKAHSHTHWNMSTPFRHPHSPRFRALPVARTHPKRHSKQKTCQNPEIRQNFITRCEAQRNSYGRRYFVSETRIWLPIRNHCVLFEHQNAQRLLGCWNKHGEDWHRAVGYTIAH